ncbi:hypothetical protein ABCR94_18585 [Streptomyces sp. 21So2-11]|uniref:hypothetical protein n=1 Tax=Streptomyces sp. 21So2-11 TaxID=3144408 RepID=UPI00321949CA
MTIEQSIGWLMRHRRLARDYERHPRRSEAMVRLAMINLMTRRLTGEATLDWRGTWPGIKCRPPDQTLRECLLYVQH